MTTADPIGKTPLKILNKGPEYIRSTSGSSQNFKTAAERLEADKCKYVKSAKARRGKVSLESSASRSSNGGGSHSVRPTSTGSSPAFNGNDNKNFVNDHNRNNVKMASNFNRGQFYSSQRSGRRPNAKLNRSNTDLDTNLKMWFQKEPRSRQKSGNSDYFLSNENAPLSNLQELKPYSPEPNATDQSKSPKPSRNGKSFSTYISKAKESIKAVKSTIAGGNNETSGVAKTRQSRSTSVKSSKVRSASAGANRSFLIETSESRQRNVGKRNVGDLTLSPQSQLKQIRQNLKKVVDSNQDHETNNSSENNNIKEITHGRHTGKTFTVVPSKRAIHNISKPEITAENDKSFPKQKPTPAAKPQTKERNSLVEKSCQGSESSKSTCRKSSSSSREETLQDSSKENTIPSSQSSASVRTLSSLRLKRRSWDLIHPEDNRLHPPLSKSPSQATSLTPDNMGATALTNAPTQRKSWNRIPPSTSEYLSSQNHPGSRKSITEALEEILNPLENDDDMDTAYNSMSPDASMECKTLVEQNAVYYEKTNSVADNLSNLLRDCCPKADPEHSLRSKTPESSRSKTPTGDDGISFSAHDVDINRKVTITQKKPTLCDSANHSARERGALSKNDREWQQRILNEIQTNGSKPLNRIDMAPPSATQLHVVVCNSSSLTPRSRREVAPENTRYSNRNTKDEYWNTLKSQNTSSSASADIDKPLTALTASDLKPRREKSTRGTHIDPFKPTASHLVSTSKGVNRVAPVPGSLSASSTPNSSLQRTSKSSGNSSLKRNRQRTQSDASLFQNELDHFFSKMGMEECVMSPCPSSQDTLFTTAPVSSESDFSFAGASAYVRDSMDESMDVDPSTASLANRPSVSIIEKNARVMRWLMTCKKSMNSNSITRSPGHSSKKKPIPSFPNQQDISKPLEPPSNPPPRISSTQKISSNFMKESVLR